MIAAAGAIAYLREYPPRLIAETMSLAATQSAGLRLQFGTVVKPLHVGIAAKNAVAGSRGHHIAIGTPTQIRKHLVFFLGKKRNLHLLS